MGPRTYLSVASYVVPSDRMWFLGLKKSFCRIRSIRRCSSASLAVVEGLIEVSMTEVAVVSVPSWICTSRATTLEAAVRLPLSLHR
jgi:hypothetical protein